MVLVNDFNTFGAAEDGVKLFIYAAIQETWYKPLRDPTTFYNNVTAYDMLKFLCTNSGGDLAMIPSDMLHYYANAEGIPEFILELKQAVKCRCRMPHCLPQHTRKSCPLSIIRRLLVSGSYYQQHPKRGRHGKPTTALQTLHEIVSSHSIHSRLVQPITLQT
jgi:hypothetical protein